MAKYSYSASQLNFVSCSGMYCIPHQLFRIPLDFCLLPWFLLVETRVDVAMSQYH